MNKRPSIKQIRNRMLPGHRHVLECLRDGRRVVHPGALDSEVRGYRKIIATLVAWGAVDRNENGLTDIGRELLA